MIITGGENVAPAEVEAVLAEHPAVAEAAVFARAAPALGRGGHGARRRPPGTELTQAALRTHCLERLARVQGAEGVRARRRAAATASGKVRRADLR